MYINNNKLAFSLLEVMIALTMLMVTIGSIYQVNDSVKSSMISTEDKVSAMYLSQEWLEFIRNRRDYYIAQSVNKENWWNKFLYEIFWSWANLNNYQEIVKNIETDPKLWIFSIWAKISSSDKAISSIEEIYWNNADWCIQSWKCVYEKISLPRNDNNISNNDLRNFYRKIVFKKDKWQNNVINVKSVVYWDNKWDLYNFSMEQELANITIF